MFDTLEAAADGLATVLTDARETDKYYTFAGISAEQILKSGLILEGDLEEVVDKLQNLEGSAIFVE
jgi:hypothetical protein